ncbi:MAG: hypothetical protein ACTHOO_03415 [Alcanivorax sp.]
MSDNVTVTNDSAEKTTWLFKRDDDFETYWVGYEIKPEQLVISDFQMGQSVKESWGDGDVEHYIHIEREHVPAFISACCKAYNVDAVSVPPSDAEVKTVLHAAFEGKRKMLFEVKDILKDNNIPYDFQRW